MEMTMIPKLIQTQSLKLTQEQIMLLQNRLFTLRMELVYALRGEKYKPRATCPSCSRELTPAEIIRGFNRNPQDFTTCCSGCGNRFEPLLICFLDGSQIEIPFYCDMQLLNQLKGKEEISPETLARSYPAVYRSAIVHHGSISQAFKKIGIDYGFEEVSDWKNKVKPFLGCLPDTTIAECVNVLPAAIRTMRKRLGISRYTINKII